MTRTERYIPEEHTDRGRRRVLFVMIALLIAAAAAFTVMYRAGVFKKEAKISFDSQNMIMYRGYSEKLKVKTDPAGADLPKMKWSSSDNGIAKVSSRGKVEPVAEGSATITAESEKGQEISCDVTVKKPTKTIYFTFDDGPSGNVTPKLLKLLKENNIKATFFIVGFKAKEHSELVKESFNNGNCIAVHTYTHEYRKIYASKAAYMSDFSRTSSLLKSITGETPTLCRMPGGSNNSFCPPALGRSIIAQLRSNGMTVVDWNASYGDSSTKPVPASILSSRIIQQIKYSDSPVILAHDSEERETSYEATKILIKYFRAHHYAFSTLDKYDGTLPLFLKV